MMCTQLFKENVLPSSVKFQLEMIRHVYFASVFSNVEAAQLALLACFKSPTYFQ